MRIVANKNDLFKEHIKGAVAYTQASHRERCLDIAKLNYRDAKTGIRTLQKA